MFRLELHGATRILVASITSRIFHNVEKDDDLRQIKLTGSKKITFL